MRAEGLGDVGRPVEGAEGSPALDAAAEAGRGGVGSAALDPCGTVGGAVQRTVARQDSELETETAPGSSVGGGPVGLPT